MSRSPATRAAVAKARRRALRLRERELERAYMAERELRSIIGDAELANGERIVMLTPAQAELASKLGYEFTPAPCAADPEPITMRAMFVTAIDEQTGTIALDSAARASSDR